jgi:hypothetical protein
MPVGQSKLLSTSIAALLTLSACSGSQSAKEPIAHTQAPAGTNGARSEAVTAAVGGDAQKLTAERIMQLQREGYKLVDRDGQTYYCRTDAKTGSHLAHETVCMTEAEATSLRDQTKQGLGRVMREQPPPQGK